MIYIVYKSLIQVGGAEKFLIEFYFKLKKRYNVKIVCKEVNKETLDFFKIDIEEILIPKKNSYLFWFKLIFNNIKSGDYVIVQSGFKDLFLMSVIKRFKYILFLHHPHFHSLDHYDLLSVLHRKKRREFISNKLNYQFYQKLKLKRTKSISFFNLNLLAYLNYFAIKNAKQLIVLSSYAKQEKLIYFNKESVYIPPAISDIFIDESKKLNNISKGNQILYFGRLTKEKRVDTIIRAFQKIENKNYKLKIIGDGPEYYNLIELAKSNKNIYFTGFLDNKSLMEEIKKSKIMITLEWADYNLTVYESIILGTRVIFGKNFNIEKFDQKLIKNNMLFYCTPDSDSVSKKIEDILKLNDPKIADFKFLRELNWSKYIDVFESKILLN